ncbi:MAG: endonuclease MutS2, partial [Enterococcus sp.]|nr:endonuclease MutS2 [Enterococcus sp.]
MNSRILNTLEYEQVKQMMMPYLVTAQGQEELAALEPVADETVIRQWLDETLDALKVQRLRGGIPIPKIENIRPHMKRIEIGADLNGHELAQVTRVLTTTSEVNRFIDDLVEGELEFARLYDWAKQLTHLPELTRRLKIAIDEDGRVTDDASDALRQIRSQIRRSEQSIRETLDG